MRALIPMFGDEPVEYHGKHYDFPLRNVLPKPFQKPHPPLWTACSQRETIESAGRWGMGALAFQFVSADEAQAAGEIELEEIDMTTVPRFERAPIDTRT